MFNNKHYRNYVGFAIKFQKVISIKEPLSPPAATLSFLTEVIFGISEQKTKIFLF